MNNISNASKVKELTAHFENINAQEAEKASKSKVQRNPPNALGTLKASESGVLVQTGRGNTIEKPLKSAEALALDPTKVNVRAKLPGKDSVIARTFLETIAPGQLKEYSQTHEVGKLAIASDFTQIHKTKETTNKLEKEMENLRQGNGTKSHDELKNELKELAKDTGNLLVKAFGNKTIQQSILENQNKLLMMAKKHYPEIHKEIKTFLNASKALSLSGNQEANAKGLQAGVDALLDSFKISQEDIDQEALLLGVDQETAKLKLATRAALLVDAGFGPEQSPLLEKQSQTADFPVPTLKAAYHLYEKQVLHNREGSLVSVPTPKGDQEILVSNKEIKIAVKLLGEGSYKMAHLTQQLFPKLKGEVVHSAMVRPKEVIPKVFGEKSQPASTISKPEVQASAKPAVEEEIKMPKLESIETKLPEEVERDGEKGIIDKYGDFTPFEYINGEAWYLDGTEKKMYKPPAQAVKAEGTIERGGKKGYIDEDGEFYTLTHNSEGKKGYWKGSMFKIKEPITQPEATPSAKTDEASPASSFEEQTRIKRNEKFNAYVNGALDIQSLKLEDMKWIREKLIEEMMDNKLKEVDKAIEKRLYEMDLKEKYDEPTEEEDYSREIDYTARFQGEGIIKQHSYVNLKDGQRVQEMEVTQYTFKDIPGAREEFSVQNLSQLSKAMRDGKLTEEEEIQALGILQDSANGLNRIHQMGYTHYDIKGDNIGVTKEGKGVLLDFGTTCREYNDPQKSFAGTFHFIAPEVFLHGETENWNLLNSKADIFSFGMTLVQFTGRKVFDHPFHQLSQFPKNMKLDSPPARQMTMAMKYEEIKNEYLQTYQEPDDKQSLEHLIWECTRFDPKERPTAAQLAEKLGHIKAAEEEKLKIKK